MNILVTGGAGFIGSTLCDKLVEERENQVFCLDNFTDFEESYPSSIKRKNIEKLKENPQFTLFEEDITNYEGLGKIFKAYSFDVIVHLAALAGVLPSLEDPLTYTNVNIKGTQYLLEQCSANNVKNFVFASSSSVYGMQTKIPFEESDCTDYPISPYGMTKKAGELLCYNYHHIYNMNILSLRFFTAYGPRQRPDLAIHKFTRIINEESHVPMFGDGSSKRDYVYIYDLVDGIKSIIDFIMVQSKPIYDVYNLGTANTVELKYLISLIAKGLGKEAIIKELPMPLGDVPITYANLEKAQKAFNYNPKTNIEKGVPIFIKWYMDNII